MTNAALRETASAWHGGQWSPLYAFASSGTVVRGAASEAEHCLHHYTDDATDEDRAALRALVDYLAEHEPEAVEEDDES